MYFWCYAVAAACGAVAAYSLRIALKRADLSQDWTTLAIMLPLLLLAAFAGMQMLGSLMDTPYMNVVREISALVLILVTAGIFRLRKRTDIGAASRGDARHP